MTTGNPSERPTREIGGVGIVPIAVFGLVIVVAAFITAFIFMNIPALRVMPAPASLQAQNTDMLFFVLFFVGGIVFFLVEGLLVYSIFRFRARRNDNSDGPAIHGNTTLEIVWTVIPSIIVIVLAILAFVVWNQNITPREGENLVNGEAITINAVGARYVWNFEYVTNEEIVTEDAAASDEASAETTLVQDTGEEAVQPEEPEAAEADYASFTSTELHVYVGQNVKLDMTTQDVIHSFWVPAMRVKQDLLPGRTTEIRFTPVETADGFQYALLEGPQILAAGPGVGAGVAFTLAEGQDEEVEILDTARTGGEQWAQVRLTRSNQVGWVPLADADHRYNRYRLVCTELCGGGHGQMYSWLIVHESEEAMLENFYNREVFAALNPPDDPVLLGNRVIENYACAGCHALGDKGWNGNIGPALNGIGDRAGDRTGAAAVSNGAEYLIQSLRQPQAYYAPGYNNVIMNVHDSTDDGVNTYMSQEDLVGVVAYLCTQTGSGNPAENTCGIDMQFNDDGSLANPEDVRAALLELSAPYEE